MRDMTMSDALFCLDLKTLVQVGQETGTPNPSVRRAVFT
jgi:hypothetical protein